MTRLLQVACCAAVLVFQTAHADGPPVWSIEGRNNTVYLFGSIHVLKQGDFALAGALEDAYEDAEAVIFEVDLDDLSPAEMAAVTAARAIDPDGRTLEDLLGPAYAKASEQAAALDIDLAALAPFEPWFAGLTIVSMTLMRDGFAAESGVERTVQSRAALDGKPISGLETLDQQLAVLDGMTAAEQSEFLLQSLAEAERSREAVEQLVAAWRAGDQPALARELKQEFEGAEDLYRALIVERNERWVEQILDLLDDEEDYLVVVGALHLVGEDGLPALLEARGHDVQLR